VRPFAPGRELAAGYEAIAHLARSNVLDVYDAWSVRRGCRCIVKALRPDRRDDAVAAKRLRREGRLLCRLTHPHIVRGYEVLPPPAVAMEMLGGETLARLIERRERRLSARELGFLGLHLCSAVGYLHAEGVLHLDVKPSNVVAEAGRAKLIDLSVARPPGRVPAGTGTWCYLAPEQARGEAVGPPADVWGLGALLWETATGRSAFDDDRDRDVPYPQLVRRADPVRGARRLPRAFTDAVDACLEPSAADRPTVGELAAACETAAGGPVDERRFTRARKK
jgi:eukaryotic-like serine/threonine-protein kinase